VQPLCGLGILSRTLCASLNLQSTPNCIGRAFE
jgi:hypothetical protein